MGEHDFTKEEGTEVWRNFEKIIVHEKYDMYENVNDIALIKVGTKKNKFKMFSTTKTLERYEEVDIHFSAKMKSLIVPDF